MAYLKNGLFQKMAYFKKWPISKFCRRHNYRKRDVFFEKKTPQLLETHYRIVIHYCIKFLFIKIFKNLLVYIYYYVL